MTLTKYKFYHFWCNLLYGAFELINTIEVMVYERVGELTHLNL